MLGLSKREILRGFLFLVVTFFVIQYFLRDVEGERTYVSDRMKEAGLTESRKIPQANINVMKEA